MSQISVSWSEGEMEGVSITCQGYLKRMELFNNVLQSVSTSILFDVGLFLILYRCTRFLLKPLRMPYVAQLLAGFIIGPIYGLYVNKYALNKPLLYLISEILSHIGFFLHLFLLGVEINVRKLARVGKRSFLVGFLGFFMSIAFSVGTYMSISGSIDKAKLPRAMPVVLLYNATNYLMTTSSNVNDLGISNSIVGQLALSSAMVVDLTYMVFAISIYYVIFPLLEGGETALQSLILLYYVILFIVFRPLVIHVIKLTPVGKPMKQMHFVSILVLVLILSLIGEIFDQKFSPFLLALTLPEEPLATVLAQKLDPFASGILFPFFVASVGLKMQLHYVDEISYSLVLILLMGYIGKFIGTMISAKFFRHPISESLTLSLILSSRGVLDVSSLTGLLQHELLGPNHYTILLLHTMVTMGIFLPLAHFFYEPSRQYSTIMRHGLINLPQNNESLLILVCIHKEDSLVGLMRLLRVCKSTSNCRISVVALQLLQLTGRCTMPIMAPLHEVSSISSFRSNIDRCTQIVNSFLALERDTEGATRAQHFLAMSPYSAMHNDICNLAYEMEAGLVIIPFHIFWSADGTIAETSLSIREVNMVVLQKAPSSVGILVDRSVLKERVANVELYMITIVFIGGADDYEALAYSRLFANNPSVRVKVIWFRGPINEEKTQLDCDVMKQFFESSKNNERISIDEVIVQNGSETVEAMVVLRNHVDLVVTGKHHNLMSTPMIGLSDGWTEYPELGVLGDILASSDFSFSILVVQQEPQNEFSLDFVEK